VFGTLKRNELQFHVPHILICFASRVRSLSNEMSEPREAVYTVKYVRSFKSNTCNAHVCHRVTFIARASFLTSQ